MVKSEDIIRCTNPCTFISASKDDVVAEGPSRLNDSPTSKSTNRLFLTRTDVRCLHEPPLRGIKRLTSRKFLTELFFVLGALILVTNMNNTQLKQTQTNNSQPKQTQTSSPKVPLQYDFDRPRIYPDGMYGYAALNVTVFGNRKIAMCLDSGGATMAFVEASLLPPGYQRWPLPRSFLPVGIGGYGSIVTHGCILHIRLPCGKYIQVPALIMEGCSAGVLLGVGMLKELRARLDIANGVVTIADGNYPITYVAGFHPINYTGPVIQNVNVHSPPNSWISSFYSTLVGNTATMITSAEKRTASIRVPEERDGIDQILSWYKTAMDKAMFLTNNFAFLEPQNTTVKFPKTA